LKPYDDQTIEAVLADKGYDSHALVAYIESRQAQAVIPSRKNSKHPREIDRELYKERKRGRAFFQSDQTFSQGGDAL